MAAQIDTKTQPAANRVYQDFEPYYEWDRDEGLFTVMLPGYTRDQLKVQVTSKPSLRLKGERKISGDIWRRFDIEFPIPSDYDIDNVSAKFEGGMLYVKFAKLIKPKEITTNQPEEDAPRPKEEPSQKLDHQNAAQEVNQKAKEHKTEARTDNEDSDQRTPQKEKEPSDEKEKSKTETAASIDKVAQEEVRTNGLTEAAKEATSKAPEAKYGKPVRRSKTRLLDFTLSIRPSNQVGSEAIGDLVEGVPNKQKKLVNLVVLILLVVGLGLLARTALRSSHGGSKFQEL